MKAKRLRGDYIGNYAPYGYLKDPENPSHLIIDQEIAPIVVEIFEMRATGAGPRRVRMYNASNLRKRLIKLQMGSRIRGRIVSSLNLISAQIHDYHVFRLQLIKSFQY